MSRIGKNPITIPEGVTVEVKDNEVTAKGKLGELSQEIKEIDVKIEDGVITLERPSEANTHKSKHGLYRALINNMIVGVTEGFAKELEIVGVGYKAELKGKDLVLSLGYSHPINFNIPEGITIEVPAPTQIKVNGINKEQVGQVAADIRKCRPPEPNKGKGLKYVGEFIQRKAGKAAAGA